ncbi:iron(III) transport system ATP-binding protein [Reichenbachiella faecimaris]|uniref:Iron(III) transport system ATP-binding protein n=1 Tax=Reichenbachiella faecimaris TaxID=692418 RepID=A0A1W2GP63_REIFA|nr:ATP-binding cassette domain-containing protein [Reichenbachiella faecimaris]SMD38066.1 iron(III) transport system ATP-binding protein [Reichenbachiella faecimaris]
MLKLDIKLNFKSYQLRLNNEVLPGETLGIYGKSGIGKSTLLKVIAGLQPSNQSTIDCDGKLWNSGIEKNQVLSKDREVGMVFQDFALFPNLTVKENLEYARRVSESDFQQLISTLDIENILDKKSTEISGGQKQRTAIGRAIAYNPSILLMDEPFAALDDQIKNKIKSFLKSYISDQRKIAIIASHDHADLEFFTDRIIMFQEE